MFSVPAFPTGQVSFPLTAFQDLPYGRPDLGVSYQL